MNELGLDICEDLSNYTYVKGRNIGNPSWRWASKQPTDARWTRDPESSSRPVLGAATGNISQRHFKEKP